MILIIIKFCEQLLRISPRIINSLRSYIKHSKECFVLFPNTSKLVKKNWAAPRFSNLLLGVWKSEETLFLVFDLLHLKYQAVFLVELGKEKKIQLFVEFLLSKTYRPFRGLKFCPCIFKLELHVKHPSS